MDLFEVECEEDGVGSAEGDTCVLGAVFACEIATGPALLREGSCG